MAYFWRCPVCNRLATFDDDENDPRCVIDHGDDRIPYDPARTIEALEGH